MIGSAAGYCQIHKMDKMFVGTEDATEPTCIRCKADATPKLGRTQIVEDPGADFNGYTGGKAKVTIIDNGAEYDASAKAAAPVRRPVVASDGLTLEEIVERAVSELGNLPMPKDIKQFKRVQKVIKTLQSLVENQNG